MKTVVINTENGPVIINESDFDPKIHTLFGDKPEVEAKAEEKPKRQYKRKGSK